MAEDRKNQVDLWDLAKSVEMFDKDAINLE